jgi:hypothetical protein
MITDGDVRSDIADDDANDLGPARDPPRTSLHRFAGELAGLEGAPRQK